MIRLLGGYGALERRRPDYRFSVIMFAWWEGM